MDSSWEKRERERDAACKNRFYDLNYVSVNIITCVKIYKSNTNKDHFSF